MADPLMSVVSQLRLQPKEKGKEHVYPIASGMYNAALADATRTQPFLGVSAMTSYVPKPAPSLRLYNPLTDKQDLQPNIPVGLIAGEILRRRAIKNGDLPSPALPKFKMLTPWDLIELQLRTQEPSLYKPSIPEKEL
jgi:hypothetical protein